MSDYNPLNEYPKLRKAAYAFQWVVNLVLGIIAIVLATLGDSPMWFLITGAVFNFVWSYTGLTAQANVTETYEHDYEPLDAAELDALEAAEE